tara:strand:- start:16724 stop:17323 length:600 start_codon:yes stop_codon:yes gene_type:complete
VPISLLCIYKPYFLEPKKIVVTGGPSTGKTSVIRILEEKGYFCQHEVIRTMTIETGREEGISSFTTNPILSVADPLEFNRRILRARMAQYNEALHEKHDPVFFDRGIHDVVAYMYCFGQEVDDTFLQACKDHSYDQVFLLPPWEEIYVADSERFESFGESLRIHAHLESAYQQFGHSIITVPKYGVEERCNFILASLKY